MRFVKAVPIRQLKPWPGNPRRHGADIPGLIKSIEAFGWTNPVLVQEKTHRIIAGHGRIEAAKAAGLTSVPCLYLDLTAQQAVAYTVADNRLAELSEWDLPALKTALAELDGQGFDVALTGFMDDDIDRMLATEPDAPRIVDLPLDRPPGMTWVLIGIPTVRFGDLQETLAALRKMEHLQLHTSIADGQPDANR